MTSSTAGLAPARVLEADDIARVITRIAHELVERNKGAGNLVLMGIRTRGYPLAARLADILARIDTAPDAPDAPDAADAADAADGDAAVPYGPLDVTLYRDDLSHRGPLPLGETHFPCDIDDRTVVLVDDVLYTGRTVRAALEAVAQVGRPRAVKLAVLVDRGHREFPIRADHVGKNLPTARDQRVRVRVKEVDGEDAVDILPAAEERRRP